MAVLTDDPSGLELEDFVAAHLASRGRFVESGVTERDPVDLLELDVVWTDYESAQAPRHPVEVKSGNWGVGDLFKFYGWSQYLDLGPGWYFTRRLPGRIEFEALERLCERLDIALFHVADLADVAERLKHQGLPDPPIEWLPSLWRYSFWIQRRLLQALGAGIEAEVCPETARVARTYQKLINDAVFFEPDVRSRVSVLMDAHWAHPRLARAVAAETAGIGVNLHDPPATQVFSSALYYGRHFPVQACLYLEQRARLSILKSAVDYIIARAEGVLPQKVVKILGFEVEFEQWALYDAFRRVVQRLEEASGYRRYPLFWQAFLWTWGGFILTDRRDAEYLQLSTETGVPVDEIDTALALWDELFPMDGGWFAQPTGDTRLQLKLMPAALRGIGAYRRLMASEVEEYNELGLSDQTPGRLATDHNTVVRLLDGDNAELIR